MTLQEMLIFGLPTVGLASFAWVFPLAVSGVGLSFTIAVAMMGVMVLSVSAGWFWPYPESDCGFCDALSELMAVSLMITALGLSATTIWNLRKLS